MFIFLKNMTNLYHRFHLANMKATGLLSSMRTQQIFIETIIRLGLISILFSLVTPFFSINKSILINIDSVSYSRLYLNKVNLDTFIYKDVLVLALYKENLPICEPSSEDRGVIALILRS